MNIVLTGLRGSGKTKIGMIISQQLGWNFVDTDKEIEKEEGKTIKEIVGLNGWEYFREKEQAMAKKTGKLDKTVIATGGGLIIDKKNEGALKKNGKIIYLHEKPEICAQRIENSKNRPPLTDKGSVKEEMKHLYEQRNNRYRESADIVFDRTDNKENDAMKIIGIIFGS
jgi:shikimate kinase